MRNCGDVVRVYTPDGAFQCRGRIISCYRGRFSAHYDVQEEGGDRLRMIPDARLRGAHIPMPGEAQHIKDYA
jgi:hypothetical protein